MSSANVIEEIPMQDLNNPREEIPTDEEDDDYLDDCCECADAREFAVYLVAWSIIAAIVGVLLFIFTLEIEGDTIKKTVNEEKKTMPQSPTIGVYIPGDPLNPAAISHDTADLTSGLQSGPYGSLFDPSEFTMESMNPCRKRFDLSAPEPTTSKKEYQCNYVPPKNDPSAYKRVRDMVRTYLNPNGVTTMTSKKSWLIKKSEFFGFITLGKINNERTIRFSKYNFMNLLNNAQVTYPRKCHQLLQIYKIIMAHCRVIYSSDRENYALFGDVHIDRLKLSDITGDK